MKMKIKKTLVVISFCFFLPLFALAAGESASAGDQLYYSFSVTWDSENNVLTFDGGKDVVNLTEENLLKDTGSGSQFYARVINFDNKAKYFSKGNAKLYLGQWKLEGSSKKGEVKITAPYFADGSKIVIFKTSDKKVALVIDVSNLAKTKTSSENGGAVKAKKKTNGQSQPAGVQTYLIGGHSAAYWWTIRIVISLVLIGIAGYFVYRWRRKKEAARAGDVTNLVKGQK
jgi:cbb3-type cytochrome oxidase subunit 3